MHQEAAYRNKCQKCYKRAGSLIFECYCILCEQCHAQTDLSATKCQLCGKPTRHIFIDVKDRNQVSRLQHLFSNPLRNLNRTEEAFRFQEGVDAKYIRFLEKRLNLYTRAVNELVRLNPGLKGYFDSALGGGRPQRNRSSSENTQLQQVARSRLKGPSKSNVPRATAVPTSRSTGGGEGAFREQQPVRVAQMGQQRNFSGGYRAPSINNNTALRSNRRTSQYSSVEDDDLRGGFFDRKR